MVLIACIAIGQNSFLLAQSPPRKTISLPNGAAPIPVGPYQPTWESIRQNYKTPAWFVDAKFGIMMHWGLYSIAAKQSEWYPMHMYNNPEIAKWHQEKYGPQDKFGYKDFVPMFTTAEFDPDAWAELFRRSGAKYIIPTAEHHDGFALWDSKLTRWDAKDMGPKRDLIGELAKAVRKKGLKFGVSNHRMEHWSFMYPKDPKNAGDLFDPAYADFYGPPQPLKSGEDHMSGAGAPQSKEFLEEWLARNQELIDNYQPDILWFDNGINDRGLDPVKLRLAAYYYNRAAAWKKQVSLSTKHDAYLAGTIKDYERQSRAPKETTDYYWQVDDPVLYRFGYTEGSPIVDARTVITRLIENVSRNGALLLNISPKADGTIPDDQQKLLLEIGRWLDVNGEGIYGTRPWIEFGEGERDAAQFCFSAKKNVIFAYALGGVANNSASIVSLSDKGPRTKVTSVELLGREGKLKFTQRSDALVIELPQKIDRSLPFGFRIKVKQ